MRQLVTQGSRFALVGVMATLVHYLVLALLVDGLQWLAPTPATAVGSLFGIATAYSGNYLYVFRMSDGRHHHYLPRFLVIYALVMSIHAGMMYLFVDILALPYHLGFIVATVFSAITTFLANRLVVFRSHA